MNSLVVLPEELQDKNTALISGDRAKYILKYHDLKEEITIPVTLFGGKRGTTRVVRIEPDKIELELALTLSPLVRSPTSLIVAIPRPQSVKKVVQLASMLGVEELLFISSARVVKSYLQSKSLEDENLFIEVIKGLEQSGDSIAPKINIYRSWRAAQVGIQELISRKGVSDSLRLIASTKATSSSTLAAIARTQLAPHTLFAVGPESGWSEHELEAFLKMGFESITLGPRVLRVEIACCYLLGQIDLYHRVTI